ncbi:hypothetical protein G3I26_34725, partial [Streptomyces sp. SID7909]|nr:hypothetical protein [Streptomyces sp. SID7909]
MGVLSVQVRCIAAAAGLVAALIPVSAAHAAGPDAPSAAPRAATTVTTLSVPLPTGDSVTVERAGDDLRSATVTPAAGREGVSFTTASVGDGDLSVVPEDAEPLLAAGRLDPRLFDIGALLDAGYGVKGATARGALGVIVQHGRGTTAASRARDAV